MWPAVCLSQCRLAIASPVGIKVPNQPAVGTAKCRWKVPPAPRDQVHSMFLLVCQWGFIGWEIGGDVHILTMDWGHFGKSAGKRIQPRTTEDWGPILFLDNGGFMYRRLGWRVLRRDSPLLRSLQINVLILTSELETRLTWVFQWWQSKVRGEKAV